MKGIYLCAITFCTHLYTVHYVIHVNRNLKIKLKLSTTLLYSMCRDFTRYVQYMLDNEYVQVR